MTRQTGTRQRIVRAAEDVVISDGVARLTLEAAAAQAGISKGGVLYHFPTRTALVEAMVERFVVSFDADLERYGAYDGKPGDFTRAYVEATLEPGSGGADEQRERRFGSALLAGVAAHPDLLLPLRERFDAWQSCVESDGLDPSLATVIRYAVDGLWLSEMFGLAPLRADNRESIAAVLSALVERAGS